MVSTHSILQSSNKVTFFGNIFNPQLVDSADTEPADMEGQL